MGVPAEPLVLRPLAARGGVRGGAREAGRASGWVGTRRDPDPGETGEGERGT